MENLLNIIELNKDELEEKLRTKMGGASKNIIEMHYGLNGKDKLTLDEISTKLNITKEKVRSIEVKAIMFLKNN